MSLTRRQVVRGAALAGAALALPVTWGTPAVAAPPLLRKWRDPLAIPPRLEGTDLSLSIVSSTHRFHSQLAPAPVLAYQADGAAPSYLGPTIIAKSGTPTTVTATNALGEHPLAASLDPAVHGTQPQDATRPRTAVHLHGGNTSPGSDGGPLDTFPRDQHGDPVPGFEGDPARYRYSYGNTQDAAGLWYHDHALGITRLNVYAGLAAGYLIRDTESTGIDTGDGTRLPAWPYELPLILQDRTFNPDGSLLYDPAPWVPEFFGDTPVVNGVAYPFHAVARGVYRFRVYNGSNARFYRLNLKVKSTGVKMGFWQIGGDGGLLNAPVPLTQLLLAPGERADLLVDFRGLAAGELVEMGNNAVTPFPTGPTAARKGGVPLRQVMQFVVDSSRTPWVPDRPIAGMNLRPQRPIERLDGLAAAAPVRSHSLVEILDPQGAVLTATLNNRSCGSEDFRAHPVTPGTLEVWEFANTTMDTHPIHLHLVQFQVLGRQPFDAPGYLAQYPTDAAGTIVLDAGPYPAPSPTPFLLGAAQPPAPNEMGWKDTVQAPPGMVTRIAVPFGVVPGYSAEKLAARQVFPGDYVWHCHILEHEDNDMMQRYVVG